MPATSLGSPIRPSGSAAAIAVLHRLGQRLHLRRRDHARASRRCSGSRATPTRRPACAPSRRGPPSRPCRRPGRAGRSRRRPTRSRPRGRRRTRDSASNAARMTLNGPVRLVATSLSHSSSGNRSARWIVSTTPAFATTASQPPRSSISRGHAGVHGRPVADVEVVRCRSPPRPSPRPRARRRSPCPRPPSAPVTIARRWRSALTREPVPLPVLVRDVGGVLVPVPSARIVVEVARRMARDRPGSRSTGSGASRS